MKYWKNFNSRPSARGDTKRRSCLRILSFQFTPLREGRHRGRSLEGKMVISIHAPPRGATTRSSASARSATFQFTPLREGRHPRRSANSRMFISIHAPPRGATCSKCSASLRRRYFNSRPSARGDPGNPACSAVERTISIHAPPRGATKWGLFTPRTTAHFNSRPSARGDPRSR